MSDTDQSISEMLRQDRRYKIEAYAFVFDALRFGHEKLGMGTPRPAEKSARPPKKRAAARREPQAGEEVAERHLTGQELCEAIRLLALEQFGYMAKHVFNNWGVHGTGDFGEIVFNLIRAGEMRKTDSDRREDFDDVFDFEEVLQRRFEITVPEEQK